MWITVEVERVLRVDRGRNIILCDPMIGPGHQTLVLKLKGDEMSNEVQRLRSALENIADWRNVNISGEYEHGLRDIIRSIVDCAVAALDSPTQRQALQAAPVRGPDCACCEQQPRKDCSVPGCAMKDAEWAVPAPQAVPDGAARSCPTAQFGASDVS
jgi:hypothetical protein